MRFFEHRKRAEMKIPHDRYQIDVMGMPCYAATEKLVVVTTFQDKRDGRPLDDEYCAAALACKRQLQSPYASVGRSRTDVALPHPKGVLKPGHGATLWAVQRFMNSIAARKVIIAADTGTLNDEGEAIELLPPRAEKPGNKKTRNVKDRENARKYGRKQAKADKLTEMGVRILTGQRRRSQSRVGATS